MKNTNTLYDKTRELTFSADQIANGSRALLDEVATGKVTGEEEYWSRTDLWDFQANVDGARVGFDGLRPLLQKKDAALDTQIDEKFVALQVLLDAQQVRRRIQDLRRAHQGRSQGAVRRGERAVRTAVEVGCGRHLSKDRSMASAESETIRPEPEAERRATQARRQRSGPDRAEPADRAAGLAPRAARRAGSGSPASRRARPVGMRSATNPHRPRPPHRRLARRTPSTAPIRPASSRRLRIACTSPPSTSRPTPATSSSGCCRTGPRRRRG